VADTDSVGYTDGSYGSRTTFAIGWAVYAPGQRLKRELIERAAQYFDQAQYKLWEVSAEEVTFEDGVFSLDGQQTCTEPCPERSRRGSERITFKELAARLDETGGPMMVSATVFPEGMGPGVATHIVDVEVDPEKGKVDIMRYTAVQDVGKAIHPGFVEGQLQGGVAQGIGWALNEEYVYDEEGHLLNASFLDYRIPTCPDLPMVDTVLVEVPNPGHPYGVRGVGEPPILPPPAAIANAIYRAVGVRMNVLPTSPTNILEALWEKQAEEG